MITTALNMLFGDRVKHVVLVLGLSLAAFLITQQGAIFLGLMQRATGPVQNITQADLWVTDSSTRYISEFRPLSDSQLQAVRSAPGVEWAEPLFVGRGLVELPDGRIHFAQVLGIDRTTLIGQPPRMLQGSLDDLRRPNAVIIDETGRRKLGNLRIGDELKLNDRRAVVVGICQARGGFDGNTLIYTTLDQAYAFVPVGRKRLSYVLVKCADGANTQDVADAIGDGTHLVALTRAQLSDRTVRWVLRETGIGINFSITVLLGIIVGLVIAAAILYQFTTDNIRHFAVFKALGATSRQLALMVVAQAIVVGVNGFAIGIGFASAFALAGRSPEAQLVAYLPWQLPLFSAGAMTVCVALGSLLSLRRVIRVEPGMVFT